MKPPGPGTLALAACGTAALLAGAIAHIGQLEPEPAHDWLGEPHTLHNAAFRSIQPHSDHDTGQPPGPEMPEPSLEARRPTCEIVLDSGQRVRGQLIEQDADAVVVVVDGVERRFSRDAVVELTIKDSVYEQYIELRQTIPEDAIDQRIMLVRWLLGRRAYRLGLYEADRVLELDPGNPETLRFRRHLAAQVTMLDRDPEQSARDQDDPSASPNSRVRQHEKDFPRLAPEQVNLIKVYELDLADPPEMRIPTETIDRLIERYGDHELMPSSPEARRALYRMPAPRLVEFMFRLRARDLYPGIEVIGHPEALERFRDDVHRGWLMRGCATTRCHGGQAAGRLWLYNRQINSQSTVYTNFLILDRFRLDDGQPLIRYDAPEQSPLLQMALPRPRSSYPHPPISELGREVPYHPPLTSRDSDGFRDAIRWINAMYQPRPEYPVSYTPPTPAGVIEGLGDRPQGRQPR